MRSVARRLVLSGLTLLKPLYARPGHYGSPVVGATDIRRARTSKDVPGVDLRAGEQLKLAEELAPLWGRVPASAVPGWRYRPDNEMFGIDDAAVYYSVLAHLRPRAVVEVGSGFSSAVALDAADRESIDVDFTFIEPYPARLRSLLRDEDRRRCRIVPKPVQDVPLDLFAALGAGDVLFIDSSHVLKTGSDVGYLFLEVVPRLRPGVVVHVHDIFWPFEYPSDWLRERRSWNEAYLLRALLVGNPGVQVMLWSSWLWQEHPQVPAKVFTDAAGQRPGSLWVTIA